MFGYSIPTVINHSIAVNDDVNTPAGDFATVADNATAINGASLGSNGIGVRGHTDDGHGVHGYAQGTGTAVYGQAAHADSIAVFGDSEGDDSIGVLCRATKSTSAAVSIQGKMRIDQSTTHTLGSYSGKSIPVYDNGGILVGYIPVYA